MLHTKLMANHLDLSFQHGNKGNNNHFAVAFGSGLPAHRSSSVSSPAGGSSPSVSAMAAALDAPCLSELGVLPNRNASLLSGVPPCNRSTARSPPYSPQATASIAIAITFMMMLTIVGNILVIIAVLTSRSLKGAQNLFLVSLAAADILVATLIIPFSLANELQGYWAFSSIWCEIYLALDVLFCTSSIVHLCAIALDRYLSISRPVSYGAKRTPVRIKAAIIVVWMISAVISFPPLLTLDKSEGGEEACELNSERWYILYSTIGSFFAPCVIMILVYIRIYQIAKQHTRCPPGQKNGEKSGRDKQKSGKSRKAGRNGNVVRGEPPVKVSPQTQRSEDPAAVSAGQEKKVPTKTPASGSPELQNPAGSTRSPDTQPHPDSSSTLPVQNPPVMPSLPRRDNQIPSNNEAQKAPRNHGKAHRDNTSSSDSEAELEPAEERAVGAGSKEEMSNAGRPALGLAQSQGFKGRVLNLACRHKTTVATSAGVKLALEESPKVGGTPISRRKALLNREKRFTFVLAVVMGVFVICWFPFFLSYSLQAVCPETCSIPMPLFKFFFWIGYCNSCVNPVIYTIFNHDFRKAFKRILCRDTKGSFF